MKRSVLPAVVLSGLFLAGACAKPTDPGPLEAGVTAAREDRWDEAVRYWTAALERDPGSAAAHNNLAVALEKKGDWDGARTGIRSRPAPRSRQLRDQGQLRILQAPARGRPEESAMRVRAIVILAAGLAAVAACRSLEPVLVHVDMPGVSPFPPGAFAEVVVTEFRNEAPLADLDVGRELQAYLAEGLRRAFRGAVSLRPRPDADAPAPSFWKDAAGGRERLVFLAGSVRLTSEVRKALKGGEGPGRQPLRRRQAQSHRAAALDPRRRRGRHFRRER